MTKRILVVEDQEDNRRILRDLLVDAGYEVVEVGDGGCCNRIGLPKRVSPRARHRAAGGRQGGDDDVAPEKVCILGGSSYAPAAR